jgi:hypothetical protein
MPQQRFLNRLRFTKNFPGPKNAGSELPLFSLKVARYSLPSF